ncbi:MAG: L-ribulose-5-phosphate 4-epimerase [Oleiphilaceae bacterium]|jgi:L-ribulose-5-phosphate 4-epimerase
MMTRLEHELEHEQEGVIKYQLQFKEQALAENLLIDKLSANNSLDALLIELNLSRNILKEKALIGQDLRRYGGDGFGNISVRIHELNFLISGSQTGHIETLSLGDIALVDYFNIASNQLSACGLTKPSSESMTHGVCFQAFDEIGAVLHVHSPDIWHAIDRLALPFTDQSIPYGTPNMAQAVSKLLRANHLVSRPTIFGMKGHVDGIVVVGQNLKSCTSSLLDCLNESLLTGST